MILDKILGTRSIESPSVPISSAKVLDYLGGGAKSRSGVAITSSSAMTYSPVWQAVSLIAGDVAKMPFIVYERLERGKKRATGHPTSRLLRRSTGNMTPNKWLEAMVYSALLTGNGYSYVKRTGGGVPAELVFVPASRVRLMRQQGVIVYDVTPGTLGDVGVPAVVARDDMFHLSGITEDGVGGLSIVEKARNAFGRALATEGFADDFFANNATPSGWFTYPGELSPEAIKGFVERVVRRHGGDGNRHRVGVLEDGMKWESAGITPEDALMVEAMEFGVKEAARWFNLPPHKLGDDSKTSYNSIEQENRSYLDGTLCQWISRLEYEANDKLFSTAEKDSEAFFAEFLTASLLRADTATRMTTHRTAIESGIMSRNEARAIENLNPYEGGDEFLVPTKMRQPSADDSQRSVDVTARVIHAHRELFAEQLTWVAQRFIHGAKQAAKNPDKFGAWVDGLPEAHRAVAVGRLRPTVRAIYTASGAEGEEQATQSVADRLIVRAGAIYLAASECQPDELAARVSDTTGAVTAMCRTLANELIADDLYGGF